MWVLQERKRNQNQETIEEELVDRDLLWMQTWCPAQFNAITSGLSWIRKIPFQDSKIYTLFFFFLLDLLNFKDMNQKMPVSWLPESVWDLDQIENNQTSDGRGET